MLHNLLDKQALPVSFRLANNKSTTEIAQRLLDYNLGTMLPKFVFNLMLVYFLFRES